jgi:undecaprenyl-diphosphatase
MSHLSNLQAITIGLLQGVTELFPISSLGHSVLVPALIGGSWRQLVTQGTQDESPYLVFIVGLHVATALALLCFFWRDWVRLVKAFFRTLAQRQVRTVDEKLAWLIIIGTIPAGILGIALEHALRTVFAKPVAASAFLVLNGLILFAAERLRRRAEPAPSAATFAAGGAHGWVGPSRAHASGVQAMAGPDEQATGGAYAAGGARTTGRHAAAPTGAVPALETATPESPEEADRGVVATLSRRDAGLIGVFQSLALLAGISRSGITMAAGLMRGLDHEQAVRFAFLLATPIILAAGVYKLPELAGPTGNGIHVQVLLGSIAAFVGALVSIRFLTRYFQTRTLTPFAIYCVVFGVICLAYFS